MVESRTRPIALIGIMGSGKSTTADLLSRRLGVPCHDLDRDVERRQGESIAQIFATQGEAAFRDLEQTALRQAVDDGARVIACGGGVVLRPASRRVLRDACWTVWLEVSPEVAAVRVQTVKGTRPLLASFDAAQRLAGILAERMDYFGECARVRVDTGQGSPSEVVERILAALEDDTRQGP